MRDAMELRSILEWQISPQMRQVRGVTEINSIGGFYKTFEVRLDPNRMTTLRVGLEGRKIDDRELRDEIGELGAVGTDQQLTCHARSARVWPHPS